MTIAEDRSSWPQRSLGLALLGALTGLLVHYLTDQSSTQPVLSNLRYATAAFALVTAIAIGFAIERRGARWTLGFAALAGLVIGLVVYASGGPWSWSGSESWRFICALLAVTIAAPLFQAWRPRGGDPVWRLPYPAVHDRAWSNLLIWGAAWAFVAIVWLLAQLLAELFGLIGIELLKRLLEREQVAVMLLGGAFGAGIGLLRDRDAILGTLQKVAMLVLSVLAPVFGVGLLLFLGALPFTGLAPLWEATRATTPVLLGALIGALVLINTVIGDSPDDESRNLMLRWGALALGAAMLPLALIAAVSTGLRIDQYGLTPDRLWALVFVAIGCAYALAYALALLRHRTRWAPALRGANLNLAFGLCGFALLLASPLAAFDRWSTHDQVARLTHGRVSPQKFDWAALRFDFGAPGLAALDRLAKSGQTPEIRLAAAKARKLENRWDARAAQQTERASLGLDARLTIRPARVVLPAALRSALVDYDACGDEEACTIFFTPGATQLVGVKRNCANCAPSSFALEQDAGKWRVANRNATDVAAREKLDKAFLRGEIELRAVQRRQIFIGGVPVGEAFE